MAIGKPTDPPVRRRAILAIIALLPLGFAARLNAQTYRNFESRQSRPVCLSPDGSLLFAVNTPDGRLSVFD